MKWISQIKSAIQLHIMNNTSTSSIFFSFFIFISTTIASSLATVNPFHFFNSVIVDSVVMHNITQNAHTINSLSTFHSIHCCVNCCKCVCFNSFILFFFSLSLSQFLCTVYPCCFFFCSSHLRSS